MASKKTRITKRSRKSSKNSKKMIKGGEGSCEEFFTPFLI